jgi:hypothetical protein
MSNTQNQFNKISSVLQVKITTTDLLEDFKKIKKLTDDIVNKNYKENLSETDFKNFWSDVEKIYIEIENEYLKLKTILDQKKYI